MLSNKTKQIVRPIIIILLVTLGISSLYHYKALDQLEGLTYDWRMSQIRADKKINDEVVVVLIDESSLDAMDNYAGRWPWPRFVYADILQFLSFAEPKGVLFDIMISEKHLFDHGKGETINQDDLELVEASSTYPFAYHATRFLDDKLEIDTLSSNSLANKNATHVELNKPLPEDFVSRFAIENRIISENQIPTLTKGLRSPENNNFYLPFPELAQATNGIGVVEVGADTDSVYRRARLFHNYNNNHYPSLSTTAIFDDKKYKSISREGKNVYFDDLKIPVDENEKLLVNYYGKYTTFSFSALIASLQAIQSGNLESLLIDPAELQNKYIFIGGSAAGLNDLKNTPTDEHLPGVFIHASITSNILTNDFLTPANNQLTFIVIFIFSVLTALCVLFVKKSYIQHTVPIISGAIFAYYAYYQFEHNIVIEIIAPLTSLTAAWVLSITAMVLMEGREKRKFKRMMGQYLSPAVLTTLVDNQEDFAKAEVGSTENITILFSDIRSFTNISEKLSAEKVVEMLNYYFSSMTDSIFAHEGTIDKFIGDAIMAFWGAPIISSDHPDQAVLSALDMIDRLEQVNIWMADKGLDPLGIGIGVHTGNAILGNIGSENKLDYTIIGDNVNLASRIEGLTKQYGVQILITEETYDKLTIDIPCQIADVVRVKGKKHPIKVLQPLVLPSKVDEKTLKTVIERAELSDKAFQHYLNQEWDAAIKILKTLPNKLIHTNILTRCEEYKLNPPDRNWDGVFTMTTK